MNDLLFTLARCLCLNQLLLLLIIPLGAIGLILLRAPAKATALWASLLNLAVALSLYFGYSAVAKQAFAFETNWLWFTLPGPIDVRFHVGVDGISLPMVLLATVVTVAAVAVSPASIRRAGEFYIYVLLI